VQRKGKENGISSRVWLIVDAILCMREWTHHCAGEEGCVFLFPTGDTQSKGQTRKGTKAMKEGLLFNQSGWKALPVRHKQSSKFDASFWGVNPKK
jgi:hypothetical protein